MLHRPGHGFVHIVGTFAKLKRWLPVVGLSLSMWLALWGAMRWMAGSF